MKYFGLVLVVLFLVGCTQSPGGNITGNAVISESLEESTEVIEIIEVVEEPKEEVLKVEVVELKKELKVEEEAEEVDPADFLKSLEETKKTINDGQEKTSKLDECTRLCAGDNYDIIFYRNKWYNTCYEFYYYSGMEGLDGQIAECGS